NISLYASTVVPHEQKTNNQQINTQEERYTIEAYNHEMHANLGKDNYKQKKGFVLRESRSRRICSNYICAYVFFKLHEPVIHEWLIYLYSTDCPADKVKQVFCVAFDALLEKG